MTTRIACWTLLALVGCGSASGPDQQQPYSYSSGGNPYDGTYLQQMLPVPVPENDCKVAAPTYEQVAAFDTCVMCHDSSKTGAERKSAPASVNFDSEAAAALHGAEAASMVMAGLMPPTASGLTLTAADKQQLYEWVMCRM